MTAMIVRTISRVQTASPSLVFEHRSGEQDPLLWVADGLTWAAGAGNHWRELIDADREGRTANRAVTRRTRHPNLRLATRSTSSDAYRRLLQYAVPV